MLFVRTERHIRLNVILYGILNIISKSDNIFFYYILNREIKINYLNLDIIIFFEARLCGETDF